MFVFLCVSFRSVYIHHIWIWRALNETVKSVCVCLIARWPFMAIKLLLTNPQITLIIARNELNKYRVCLASAITHIISKTEAIGWKHLKYKTKTTRRLSIVQHRQIGNEAVDKHLKKKMLRARSYKTAKQARDDKIEVCGGREQLWQNR